MSWLRSEEYRYNTMGKQKCDYCGLYYPDNMTSHGCHAEELAKENDE